MAEDITFNRILLTGSAGQLGSSLLERLKNYQGKIVCLDITEPSFDQSGGREFIQADLTSQAELEKHSELLKTSDCLIHLASKIVDSRDIKRDALGSIELNIMGTLNLLKFLPELRGICYASSYMVYGPVRYSPMDELHPAEPANIYGATKLAVENFLRLHGESNDVPAVNLRFSGIYGPGTPADSPRLIPSVIRTVADNKPPLIFGDGTELREALYIDDAVSALVQTLQALSKGTSGTYNISSGQPYTAGQLAEDVRKFYAEATGTTVPETEYRKTPGGEKSSGLADMAIDISKARAELGFEPQFSMEDGLKEHIEWYIAYGKTKEEGS